MTDDDKLFEEGRDWGTPMSNVAKPTDGHTLIELIRQYGDSFVNEEGRHVPIQPPRRILPYGAVKTIADWAGIAVDEVDENTLNEFIFAHTTEEERLRAFMGGL